jgi:WXXGXW repeat (2 copies)
MKCFPLVSKFGACVLLGLALAATGCKSGTNAADATQPADDPANANVVPVADTTTADSGSMASSSQPEQPSAQPSARSAPQPSTHASPQPTSQPSPQSSAQYSSAQYNEDNGYGQEPETYAPQPPPEMPSYQQPPCPQPGYIWTPGYWHWAQPAGYYWVPGAWVRAPYTGALWTPGYWGWRGGRYAWYRGYWGRHVGYYGGINYGFGYVGFGYQGGYWRGNEFAYNTSVNRINTTVVRNVYNYRITNITTTRISYNGGNGGVRYRPRTAELYAIREEHHPPMAAQMQLRMNAQSNRETFYNVNRGRLTETTVVVNHPLEADRDVREPAMVHYERGERPAERPVGPEPFRPEGRGPEGQHPEHPQHPDHPQHPEHPEARGQHGQDKHQDKHQDKNKPGERKGEKDHHQ